MIIIMVIKRNVNITIIKTELQTRCALLHLMEFYVKFVSGLGRV